MLPANSVTHRGRVHAIRRGSALIEVLIALIILATTGTGLVAFLGQTAHTLRHVRDQERLTRLASAQLDHLVLWDRAAFVARLGRSSFDGWTVVVRQATPDLFEVTIAADSGAVLLWTTAYRPDTVDVATP